MARLHTAPTDGSRLLLVDDDRELLRSTARLLGRHGYEVRSASDRPSMLAILRSGYDPDGVLLDWYLRDTTAEQLLPSIRELAPRARVLIVSGWAAGQPPDHLLERLGVDGFHDKGEGAALLVKRVAALVTEERR